MRTKIWMRLLGSVLLAVLAVVPALSQDKPADNMQLVREKIKADKKLLVADNMKLTETEAKSFWPVYDAYQKDLGALATRTVKLIQDYAGSYATMTNEIARKLVDESMAIESDRNKLRQTYLPKFRQTLPEIKVARYYQIENKIQAAVNYDLAAGIPLAQ
jgi:hypothetical protein